MFKNNRGGTGFDGMKESCRVVEAWHCKRPGKAFGEGIAAVALDDLELKGSSKEF